MRRGRLAGLLLAAVLCRPALAAQPAPGPQEAAPTGMVLDRVVASVNDEAVTLSEVQEEGQPVVRRIFQDFVGPERERRVEEAQQKLLEELIERRLMIQVARREGMLPSTAEVNAAIDDLKKQNQITDDAQFKALLRQEGLSLEMVRRSVTERLAIGRLLARQVRSSIILSEGELQAYYEKNRAQFERRPEVEIRHLLVAVQEGRDEAAARARAEEALAAVRGGLDFAAAVARYSDGPTKDQGGSLGRIHRGDLAPEIEAAAFSLKAGEVSDLIRTSAGFNLIKVDRIWADPVAPFAEVRETIRDRLFQEKFEAKRKEWLSGLRSRASIQILARPADLTPPQPKMP
ncbi:MAG: peptidylprolyl isomerase [Candidatus Methylomirabilales bacterium]